MGFKEENKHIIIAYWLCYHYHETHKSHLKHKHQIISMMAINACTYFSNFGLIPKGMYEVHYTCLSKKFESRFANSL